MESESIRGGALQYLAAWDVHRANVFERCESATGILSFGRMVDDVRRWETYALADRVFWIVENGLSYRGRASCERLRQAYPNATLVHTPVGSNSTEICFSIVQRKVLVLSDLQSLAGRLLAFQDYYIQSTKPLSWNFDRRQLSEFTIRLADARELNT